MVVYAWYANWDKSLTPSPVGEGWDEGNNKAFFFIVFPSPNPLPLERAISYGIK